MDEERGGGAFRNYDAQIDKGIADRTFVLLTQEEVDGLNDTVHHFTTHSAFSLENLTSTKCCLINNMATAVPGQIAMLTTQQHCPRKALNDQLKIIYGHPCYEVPYL